MKKTVTRLLRHFCRLKISSSVKNLVVFAISCLFVSASIGNPVLNNVGSGNVSVSQSQNTTTINQSSQKAILNWQSFNIKANEKTQFVQPNAHSVALNRIDPQQGASQIYGNLTANGQIILINGAGVHFGPGSTVNVGGIIVSTSGITDQNFQSGKYIFDQASTLNGTILNEGKIISAQHGLVALIGSNVTNYGVINARMGYIALGTGDKFTFDFNGDQLLNFTVDASDSSGGGSIKNTGSLIADGGQIQITARQAQGVVDDAINMAGVAVSHSVHEQGGEIILDAGAGNVTVSGKLIATGNASSKGGTVKVLGANVHLTKKAYVNVSGGIGGGEVLIGGNFHGEGPEANAVTTTVDQGAVIKANALTTGNGGNVAVWSNDTTIFNGSISAMGGSVSGNGGYVETSGHNLNIQNGFVSTLAAHGNAGTWLLDPADLTISNSATSNPGTFTNSYTADNNSTTSNVSVTDLVNGLAGGNVIIQTTSGGSGSGQGNITVAVPITWDTPNTLTLQAYNNIFINSQITIGQTAGGCNGTCSLILTAGAGNPGGGSITQTATLNGQGSVVVSAGTAGSGPSILNLSQANNYAGGTVINDNAVVDLTNVNGLGSASGAVTVNTGGQLILDAGGGSMTIVNPYVFNISGAGEGGASAALVAVGTIKFDGNINLTGDSTISAVNAADSLEIAGAVTSIGGPFALNIGAAADSGSINFDSTITNVSTISSAATLTTIFNGGTVTSSGTQTYNGAVQLGTGTTFTTTNSDVTFNSTVDSQTFISALTVAPGSGAVTFNGNVGLINPVNDVTLTGSGLVTLNGAMIANSLTTASSTVLNGGSGLGFTVLSFGQSGSGYGQYYGDTLALGNSAILIASDTNIFFGGATLAISSTGTPYDLSINSGAGAITLNAGATIGTAIDPLGNLTITSSSTSTAVNKIFATSLTSNLAIQLNDNVITSAGQTYAGQVSLGGSVTLTDSSATGISFTSGGIGTPSIVDLGTGDALTITDTASNSVINVQGDIGVSGTGAGTALGTLTFNSGSSGGVTTLSGSVYANSITTTGSTVLGSNITTTAGQIYHDAVTLSGSVVMSDSKTNVTVGNAIDIQSGITEPVNSNFDFSAIESGNNSNIHITGSLGAVGAGNALGNLVFTESGTGGTIQLGNNVYGASLSTTGTVNLSNVQTTGIQHYSGTVNLSSASDILQTTTSAGAMTFTGAILGAGDNLTLSSSGSLSFQAIGTSGAGAFSSITASTTGASNSISVGNSDYATGLISLTSGGGISLSNTGLLSTTGNVSLTANSGSIVATGNGSITANALTTNAKGSTAATTLNNTSNNNVSTFNGTDNGSGGIAFKDSIANLSVSGITQSGGGSVVINNIGGNLTLSGAASSTAGLEFDASGATGVTFSALASSSGGGLIKAIASSGNITLGSTNISTSGTVNLQAANGNISETGIGVINAGTLTAQASSGISLVPTNYPTNTNAISTFNASNATGNIVLSNTASTLNITGLSESSTGTITLTNTGTVSVTNGDSISTSNAAITINAGGLTLNTTGTINSGTQATSINSLNGGIVLGGSGGSMNISSATLQNITASVINITSAVVSGNGTPISVNGVNGSGKNVVLNTTTGSGGSVTFDIAANSFGTLTVNSAGQILQTTLGPLTVTGAAIFNANTLGGNAITLAGANTFGSTVSAATIGANAIQLSSGSSAMLLGTVTTASTLTLNSSGNITQSGIVTANTLSGTLTGASSSLNLTGANNVINNVSSLTAPGGFLLSNGNTPLTVTGNVNTNVSGSNGAIAINTGTGTYSQNASTSITSGSGNIGITANALNIASGAYTSFSTTGTLTFKPFTAGTAITLGGSSGYNFTQGEISTFGASNIVIGPSSPIAGATVSLNSSVNFGAGTNLTLNGSSISSTNAANVLTSGGLNLVSDLGDIGSSGTPFKIAVTNLTFNTNNSNVFIASAGSVNIGAGTSAIGTGSLSLSTTGLTQSGAITQSVGGGTVTVNAGAGALSLNNSSNNFTGTVSLTNSGANAMNVVDSTVLSLGNVTAGSGLLTLSGNGISQTAATTITQSGAGAVSLLGNGGAIIAGNTNNSFLGVLTASASGLITLNNNAALSLGAINAGGALTLNTQTGSVSQSTGTVTATSLTANVAGQLNLSGGTNSIPTLGVITAPGGFSLTNGNTAVSVTGAITTSGSNGNVLISTQSASGYTQQNVDIAAGSGSITVVADALSFATHTDTTAFSTSSSLTLKPFSAGTAMSLGGSSGFNLTAANITAFSTGVTGSITIGDAAVSTGAMTVNGSVTFGASSGLSLYAGNFVNSAANIISTNNLNLTARTGAIGTSLNNIDVNLSTGLTFNTLANSNAFISSLSSGLNINAGTSSVGTGNATLSANGALTESGVISANTLTAASNGNMTFNNGSNSITSFSATNNGTTGTISLTNTSPLSITGMTQNALAGTGNITINNTGNINITGTIAAGATNNLTLSSTGAIAETGSGIITSAATLSTTSVGGATFGTRASPINNAVTGFSATNSGSGDITLFDTANLNINSIHQTGGNVAITTHLATITTPDGANTLFTTNGGNVDLYTYDASTSPLSTAETLTIGTAGIRTGVNSAGGAGTTAGYINLNSANATDGNSTPLVLNGVLDTRGCTSLGVCGGSGGALTQGGGVALSAQYIVGIGALTIQGNGNDLTLGNLTLTGTNTFSVARNLIINGALTVTGGDLNLISDLSNNGVGGIYVSSAGSILVTDGNLNMSGSTLGSVSGFMVDTTTAGIDVSAGRTVEVIGDNANTYTMTLTGKSNPSAAGGTCTAGTGCGNVYLSGSVITQEASTGAVNLSLVTSSATGDIDVNAGSSLSTTGSGASNVTFNSGRNIDLASSVSSTGTQSYTGPVKLGATTTEASTGSGANGNITFNSTIDGGYGLSVNTTGVTTFAGNIGGNSALTTVSTDTGGSTRINGNVVTSSTQTYGDAVTLTGSTSTMNAGGLVKFSNTLVAATAGVEGLIVTGAAEFDQLVGGASGVSALSSLSVSGASTVKGGAINTTGNQSYLSTTQLTQNTTFTSSAGGVDLEGVTSSGVGLTVSSFSTTTLGGIIGAGTPLSSLTVSGSAIALNNSTISVNAPLVFSAPVTTGTSSAITANSVTFQNSVSGTALTLNGNSGNNTFSILGNNNVTNILVNGSANGNNTLSLNNSLTQNWTVNSTNQGGVTTGSSNISFNHIGNLVGGANNNNFVLNGGTLSGSITGGNGVNSLTADNTVNSWNINATNSGTVTGVGGSFSQIQNLTGGTAGNTFVFGNNGVITGAINGNTVPSGGYNIFDYSVSYSNPVTLNVNGIESGSMQNVGSFTNINYVIDDSNPNSIINVSGLNKTNVITVTGATTGYINDPIYFSGFVNFNSTVPNSTASFNVFVQYDPTQNILIVNGTQMNFTNFSNYIFNAGSSNIVPPPPPPPTPPPAPPAPPAPPVTTPTEVTNTIVTQTTIPSIASTPSPILSSTNSGGGTGGGLGSTSGSSSSDDSSDNSSSSSSSDSSSNSSSNSSSSDNSSSSSSSQPIFTGSSAEAAIANTQINSNAVSNSVSNLNNTQNIIDQTKKVTTVNTNCS